MKFSGLSTIDKSDIHIKGQGQISKVKVTEAKTKFVTAVWITDGYGMMQKACSGNEEVSFFFF